MIPLILAEIGKQKAIKKIKGKDETRRFLENLGFVVGSPVTVVSNCESDLIINVKNTRIALGKSIAKKIMI
jgi:ferrous iron transport protein A